MYDVYDPGGWVNEDVFAYSNRHGDERAMIVYHNRFAEAKGWIRESAAFSVPDGGGRRLVRKSLGEGLGLHPDGEWYTLLREQRSGLEFVRRSSDLCRDGLYVELHAYGCQVFMDIHETQDGPSGNLGRLADRLNGAGVPSVATALREMHLEPLHTAVRGLAEDGSLRRVAVIGAARAAATCPGEAVDLGLHGSGGGPKADTAKTDAAKTVDGVASEAELARLLGGSESHVRRALRALIEVTGASADVDAVAADFRSGLEAALRLPEIGGGQLCAGLTDDWTWIVIIGRLVSRSLSAIVEPEGGTGEAIDELQLGPVIAGMFGDLGLDDGAAWRLVALIRMLRHLPLPSSVGDLAATERAPALVRVLVADQAVRPYIRVNVWEGISWFNSESFGQVLWWMAALDALDAAETAAPKAGKFGVDARKPRAARLPATRKPPAAKPAAVAPEIAGRLRAAESLTATLARAAKTCGYQLDDLEEAARR